MKCEFDVKVVPKSSANKIEATEAGIKVWVTAPPVDGQANRAVVRLVADRLGVAPSRVEIVRGHVWKTKTLAVEGMNLEQAISALQGSSEREKGK